MNSSDERSSSNDEQSGAPGGDDLYARGATGDAPAGTDPTAGDAVVTDALQDPQRQLDEQRDRYLRLAAEYDNFRRRTAKERQEMGNRAQADLLRSILDALDDLGRIAHVDASSPDALTIVEGVAMVERKLLKSLTTAGLEVVNPVEQPFDPAMHEAVATEPAAAPEDDHVVARVYQLGYVFSGQLLRPARVVVKQWNG